MNKTCENCAAFNANKPQEEMLEWPEYSRKHKDTPTSILYGEFVRHREAKDGQCTMNPEHIAVHKTHHCWHHIEQIEKESSEDSNITYYSEPPSE